MKYTNLRKQIDFSKQECEKIPKKYSVDSLIKNQGELIPIDELIGYGEDEIQEFNLYSKNVELSDALKFNPADYSVIDGDVTIDGPLLLHSYTQCVLLITGDLTVNELFLSEGIILIVKGNTNVDVVIFDLSDAGSAWFTKKLDAKNIVKMNGEIIGVENEEIELDENISDFPEFEEVFKKLNSEKNNM